MKRIFSAQNITLLNASEDLFITSGLLTAGINKTRNIFRGGG